MEKIPERLSKNFRCTRLFKDHLETIDKLFVENFTKTNIYVGNYKYDNVAELLQYEKGRLNNFKIEGLRNNNRNGLTKILSLTITSNETKLIIFDKDDLKSMGVMKIVEDIIIRNSWFGGYLTFTEIIFSIILSPIITYLLIKYSPNPGVPDLLRKSFLCFIVALILFICIATIDNHILFRPNIYLRYKREFPNFIIRNKDSILVGLICCILGTIIGGLIVYIITNLGKTKGG